MKEAQAKKSSGYVLPVKVTRVLKFRFIEKATNFPQGLGITKWKISQIFVAFSEYLKFKRCHCNKNRCKNLHHDHFGLLSGARQAAQPKTLQPGSQVEHHTAV